ncbi:hypothetical protein D9M68_625420 [compost metagenome]
MSPRRVPSARIRSLESKAATCEACVARSRSPAYSACVFGKRSCWRNDTATGTPCRSANRRSASRPPGALKAPPAMTRGRRAAASRACTRASVAGAGWVGLAGSATQSRRGTAACCTSSGTTSTTGPGVPDVATRRAFRAAQARSSDAATSWTHLAIEPNMRW